MSVPADAGRWSNLAFITIRDIIFVIIMQTN